MASKSYQIRIYNHENALLVELRALDWLPLQLAFEPLREWYDYMTLYADASPLPEPTEFNPWYQKKIGTPGEFARDLAGRLEVRLIVSES